MELRKALSSSVGRKYLMALSGIGLVVFIIMHLAGNLTLFDSSGHAFNKYAKSLHDWGWVALAAEVALAGLFLFHIVMAFVLTTNYRSARPVGYAGLKTKGGPSKSNLASRNMIVTGSLLMGFLIFHIWQFRFGPGLEQGYSVEIGGDTARDLFRLVSETFHDPINVGIYVAAMLFLGIHIRHGFWSMFQSLGAMYPRWSPTIYCTAFVAALLLSLGFVVLPVFLFLVGG